MWKRAAPFIFAIVLLIALIPRPARAFGDIGAFDPRALLAGGTTGPARLSAGARWSWELVQRTSAPARLKPTSVRADDPSLVDGPFLWWSGENALTPLTPNEIAGLRKFFALGGILLVDDAGVPDDSTAEVPHTSPFTKSAREQIARVLPDTSPIPLAADHVLFKSYYLLKRAEGRVAGPRTLDAIVRGGQTQVVFSAHDLGGALARGATGAWEQPVVPGGDIQRERAIRLAVNIAMYVLCSNYKDDQVHAPFLMRAAALAPSFPEMEMTERLAVNGDLPSWAALMAVVLVLLSLGVLVGQELRKRERGGLGIVFSGLLAVVALLLAVLRPVRIAARESAIGPKVVVLADQSRSMALPQDGKARSDVELAALEKFAKSAKSARLLTLGFGDGAPVPVAVAKEGAKPSPPVAPRSDLTAAIRALSTSAEERPQAVVVISDGRLDDPAEEASKETLAALGKELKVPIHTIATTREGPPDASVRRVSAAGAAVAHVPLPLRVEVGCSGGISCDELTVTARELREDGPPALLATGLSHLKDGKGTVDLSVTLERAGARIIEVAITPPSGDTIPENDRRLMTFVVARERVRVLHVAGRPTNDVRALRQWLKSDASVDVVAFFILRTQSDNPNARQEDLSLIPFPVDELFTEHLPSFDAVVLQDFDAQPYGLEKHLPALAKYVRAGGGLIMVGGQNSFIAGGYAGTPLAEVLPVSLDNNPGATAADVANVTPTWTEDGKSAPLLAPLRDVVDGELPTMPGANILGDVRPGGLVLWSHPSRNTKSGAPMPILAIGDQGDGRSIALGIDGAWQLEFSQLGARTSGRGYGAMWDGLLGWLMRDPRFEPGQLDLTAPCVANEPAKLRVRAPDSVKDKDMVVELRRLDQPNVAPTKVPVPKGQSGAGGIIEVTLPPLEAGGYTARLKLGPGPTTRRDFACEAGGDEWADSRPDPDRLRAIANVSGGTFHWADEDLTLPLPKPAVISAERHVVPLAPPWSWTLAAAALLGIHWFTRRRSGLS